MYCLVTDSRYNDSDNLAVLNLVDDIVYHHLWSFSILESFNDPEPQSYTNSLEEILADPDSCADTVLLTFSSLDEVVLTHPEFLI